MIYDNSIFSYLLCKLIPPLRYFMTTLALFTMVHLFMVATKPNAVFHSRHVSITNAHSM